MRKFFLLGVLFLTACPGAFRGAPAFKPAPVSSTNPAPSSSTDPVPSPDAGVVHSACAGACNNLKAKKCPEGIDNNCLEACIKAEESKLINLNPGCIAEATNVKQIRACSKSIKCK